MPAGVYEIGLTFTNTNRQQARITRLAATSQVLPRGDLPLLVVTGTQGGETIPEAGAMLGSGTVDLGTADERFISAEPFLRTTGFTIDGETSEVLNVFLYTKAPRVRFSLEVEVQIGDRRITKSLTHDEDGHRFEMVSLSCTSAGVPGFADAELLDVSPTVPGLEFTALSANGICSTIGAVSVAPPRVLANPTN